MLEDGSVGAEEREWDSSAGVASAGTSASKDSGDSRSTQGVQGVHATSIQASLFIAARTSSGARIGWPGLRVLRNLFTAANSSLLMLKGSRESMRPLSSIALKPGQLLQCLSVESSLPALTASGKKWSEALQTIRRTTERLTWRYCIFHASRRTRDR